LSNELLQKTVKLKIKRMSWKVRVILVTILAGAFFACKKPADGDCIPESFEFKFQQSTTIDTTRLVSTDPGVDYFSYTLKPGNKIVFTYKHRFKDCPPIADDEGERTIIFEIPEQSDSFQYNDSVELLSAKTLISYSCFCYPSQPVLLKKGFVEGTKISTGSWRIKAQLQMPWNIQESVSFDDVFTLQ
jgi:hypothetical protein